MKLTYDRMLNKKEVLDIVGISATSQERKKVFEDLPQYKNPYSKTKIFKLSDVKDLVDNFEVIAST